MNRIVELADHDFAYGRASVPTVSFLRSAVSSVSSPIGIRPECDLVPDKTVILDGINHLRSVRCKVVNCPVKICILNDIK